MALGTSFGIVPLFSSNQNHHFLIGLARAGDGWLAGDWLSHTVDPFPIFSALVEIAHRTVGDGIHYFLYYALFGLYRLRSAASRGIRVAGAHGVGES